MSYFIIIFTLFSPILTIATLPGCRAVLMDAEPFSLTAEPALDHCFVPRWHGYIAWADTSPSVHAPNSLE
ncbi:MAG: hypothetical protein J6I52_12355 [Prevotella sp.]|nr:hypothetical protein [Prevotella sp.]